MRAGGSRGLLGLMSWEFPHSAVSVASMRRLFPPARRGALASLVQSPLLQRVPGRGWQAVIMDPATLSSTLAPQPSLLRRAWEGLAVGFVPSEFPDSVTSGYLAYVRWTCLGLLSGRIQSVLATQAALFTIGLGAGAIPMAAAVQWILKDGVGHAGAIVYAAAVNTRFDADAKRYRFQATIALTLADTLAVLMPLVPQHFFVMASLSRCQPL